MGVMKNIAVRRALSRSKTRINPTLEQPVPLCPYCNKRLDGPIVNGLHAACTRKYSAELAEWDRQHPLLVGK